MDTNVSQWGRSVKAPTVVTLESVYDVPDPYDSADAFTRYFHEYIKELTRAEVMYELERVRLRLLLGGGKRQDAWLLDRLDRLQREVAQRDHSARGETLPGRRRAG